MEIADHMNALAVFHNLKQVRPDLLAEINFEIGK